MKNRFLLPNIINKNILIQYTTYKNDFQHLITITCITIFHFIILIKTENNQWNNDTIYIFLGEITKNCNLEFE